MRRNTELKTPWSDYGLMHDPGATKTVDNKCTWPDVGEWRNNPVFSATLKMIGTERGRSAAFFRWEVVEGDLPAGLLLPMFITDVGHVIKLGLPKLGGTVSGKFFVVKRGKNYGVTPVEPVRGVPPRGQERPTEGLELSGRPMSTLSR